MGGRASRTAGSIPGTTRGRRRAACWQPVTRNRIPRTPSAALMPARGGRRRAQDRNSRCSASRRSTSAWSPPVDRFFERHGQFRDGAGRLEYRSGRAGAPCPHQPLIAGQERAGGRQAQAVFAGVGDAGKAAGIEKDPRGFGCDSVDSRSGGMAQEDVPGLSGLGGEAEIEIADLVLGMGEEEGRRQEQGLGARVARFTREGYGILEGRAAHAGHERDAAAFGRKVNQARSAPRGETRGTRRPCRRGRYR